MDKKHVRAASILAVMILLHSPGRVESACDTPTSKKAEARKDIFCSYDSWDRPVLDHKEATNVSIQILLKSLDYDEHSAGLTLNFWMTASWMDRMLTWKPEEKDDIRSIVIDKDFLWVPDISVYNRLEQSGSALMIESDHCILKHTGKVSCVSPNNHQVLCEPNLKYIPFDSQECALVIGSWVHEGEEVNVLTTKSPVNLADFKNKGEWQLKSVNVTRVSGKYECCPNSTFPYLEYTFTIERHSGVYVCITIVPAITMFVMTFISFFMDVKGQERTMVIVSNIILHVLYTQFYGWTFPLSGPESPLLLTYTRDSLIMTTCALVLTTVLRKLILCKRESPRWVATVTGFAMNSRAVQLGFMFDGSLKDVAERLGDDDGRNIIENVQTTPATNADWRVIAKLLDRVALISYFVAYAIMCIAFIP